MKVTVNGVDKTLKEGATVGDALGPDYVEGSDIAIRLSVERIQQVTDDFEIVMPEGTMVIHLYDTPEAKVFRDGIEEIKNVGIRWITKQIVAMGSFPSDLKRSDEVGTYRENEVFFALGGNDNQTTYVMIARDRQRRAYGAGPSKIGRITVGRHLMNVIKEGEQVVDIRPVTSETSKENVVVTKDKSYPLADGYSVDTRIEVELDEASPASAEQFLIAASKGYIGVSESSGTFMGCRDDMDVDIPVEDIRVREAGSVCVRNEGVGEGHILIYRKRRQLSPSLNVAGHVVRGMPLAARASEGERIAVKTIPPRILSVGMTQKDAEEFLASYGIKQVRQGDTSDDAIVVEQSPEMTLSALSKKDVDTYGVPRGQVYRIRITAEDSSTLHYFNKVTGLSHKPIGRLQVQFAFPGSPMVTFEGDVSRGQDLVPQDKLFKKSRKRDIGITNQSRPHHGLIGIRLIDSNDYGPTGEEPYGTNIVGRFEDDLTDLENLEDDQFIYITEEKI